MTKARSTASIRISAAGSLSSPLLLLALPSSPQRPPGLAPLDVARQADIFEIPISTAAAASPRFLSLGTRRDQTQLGHPPFCCCCATYTPRHCESVTMAPAPTAWTVTSVTTLPNIINAAPSPWQFGIERGLDALGTVPAWGCCYCTHVLIAHCRALLCPTAPLTPSIRSSHSKLPHVAPVWTCDEVWLLRFRVTLIVSCDEPVLVY